MIYIIIWAVHSIIIYYGGAGLNLVLVLRMGAGLPALVELSCLQNDLSGADGLID